VLIIDDLLATVAPLCLRRLVKHWPGGQLAAWLVPNLAAWRDAQALPVDQPVNH